MSPSAQLYDTEYKKVFSHNQQPAKHQALQGYVEALASSQTFLGIRVNSYVMLSNMLCDVWDALTKMTLDNTHPLPGENLNPTFTATARCETTTSKKREKGRLGFSALRLKARTIARLGCPLDICR